MTVELKKYLNMNRNLEGYESYKNMPHEFRPYVMFQGDHTHVQILNSSQVICETTPSKDLIVEYKKNLDLFQSHDLNNIDETRKQMHKYFEEMAGGSLNINIEEYEDSDNKVIKGPWVYPGSDTIN